MATKRTSKDAAKPVRKRAAKKVAPRLRKQPSGRRGAVGASIQAGVNRIPEEWQDGPIVPAAPAELVSLSGKRAFLRDLSISAAAARRLAERDVLVLNRSHLKPSHRKHFESAGTWKHGIWFRHDRFARTGSRMTPVSERHASSVR